MVFSSLVFLYRFFPAVLLAYYIAPRSWCNFVLFVFSLIFYAWGEPVYIFLMLLSIFIAYVGGLVIEFFSKSGRASKARAALIISSLLGLSLLIFFKYANFFHVNIPLPVGISFYTFQTLSYVIDIYRGNADVQKNFISFGTYIAMFPQLIAGPIVRYSTIDKQLHSRRENFSQGFHRFIIGLGKKILLANNIGVLWDAVKNLSELPILTAWLGLFAFTFQIYFDFSGYSDMAIGLGKIFGFTFQENFNYPYTSKSISEFWRRWHISLGSWFREYVYIPLGGNRSSAVRNIFVVWLLTGIWHGASLNFAVWGLYYAVLLTAEKIFFGSRLEKFSPALRNFCCMFFVMLGWNIFAFDDFHLGLDFFGALFGLRGFGFMNGETIFLLCNNFFLLLFCFIGSRKFLPPRILNSDIFCAVILLLSTAWLVDESFNPFLYFRF